MSLGVTARKGRFARGPRCARKSFIGFSYRSPVFCPRAAFFVATHSRKPTLDGEIVERFVAGSLQDFIEQLSSLRGRQRAIEHSLLRLFELHAKLQSLAPVGLLRGFLEPAPVARAIGAKKVWRTPSV